MHKLIPLFILALFCSAALAEDKGSVVIHGFDKMSCADWLASEKDPDVREQYSGWIRGIVTGYNFAMPNQQVGLGQMPGDFRFGLYVDRYCRDHRSEPFAGAVFVFLKENHDVNPVQTIPRDSDPAGKKSKDGKGRENARDPESTAPEETDSDEFKSWLARQSEDMRQMDIEMLRSIYKKEMALDRK